MHGQVIPLISRRVFPFTGAAETVMVKQIDITNWARLDLCVRVHSASGLATGGPTINVNAIQYSQDPGDPGEDFIGANVGTVSVDSNTAGQLIVDRLDIPYGDMLRFSVEGVTSVAATFEAELSFYLVGRESN